MQIGTGPFMLKSFTPGAESVHVRYDGYWGGPALLDEVQIIDFADATAAVTRSRPARWTASWTCRSRRPPR